MKVFFLKKMIHPGGWGRRDDKKLEDEFRARDEWRLRMKKNSECEESRDGTEKINFRVRGVKYEVQYFKLQCCTIQNRTAPHCTEKNRTGIRCDMIEYYLF